MPKAVSFAMPKIDAPTVAEHRANQERALLDAARGLLLEGGADAVTPAAVGAVAGLARSSVYKYFRSGDEILARIVADSFAEWGAWVRDAVDRRDTADDRITAYVRVTLELAAAGAHRVAVLGGGTPGDPAGRAVLARHHRDLAAPLRAALTERGDPDPELTAALVDGVLGRAIDRLDAGEPVEYVTRVTTEFLCRALRIIEFDH
ncbi:TetR/AcrR family transcriptional regulator [Nocardia sp. NPDC101769]|uniref:TetR/AcrR family transcriptional regulator n=1 Tax=Nocardia sp. NPDC101769 TaxID=3364333 RepID=UPI0037FB4914